MRRLLAQFARFGVVGGVGFVVDLAVFNVLLSTVLSPERVHEGPLLAKVISSAVAIATNWIGNRYWTFRSHRGRRLWLEGLRFALASIAGVLVGLACLWVSHYLLGFTSRLADNLSGNVIGLGIGTLVRFALYKTWVFRVRQEPGAPDAPGGQGTRPVPVVAGPR